MGNKLYVGNLAYSVRDDDLGQAFGQFGAVTSAKVMMDRETGRSKGFGFVEMGSDAEAQAAINGLNGQPLAGFGKVSREELRRFDIKQPVFFADINWNQLLLIINERLLKYQEIPRQLPVYRDLAMVIPSEMAYENVEKTVKKLKLNRLKEMKLFDIFESDKLGKGKKSVAVNFMFLDPETTLTDAEIEGMMNKLMQALEKELQAEIRKQ